MLNFDRSVQRRLLEVLQEESAQFRPMVLLGNGIAHMLPEGTAVRLRCLVLRSFGWRIDRSTYLMSVPKWSGKGPIRGRLTIAPACFINTGCHFELSDNIRLEDNIALGHDVLILTSTHHLGAANRRMGPLTTAPVVVGSGVWIGSRSVILPGVTIGPGSVVAAGSVVVKDVPSNVVVGGTPARILRELDG